MKRIHITAICPGRGEYPSAVDLLEVCPEFHVLDRPKGLYEPGAWVVLSRTDILLIDAGLIEQDGITALRKLIVNYPRLRILSIFEKFTENRMMEAILIGVHGVMAKADTGRHLQKAICSIQDGEIWMPRELLVPLRNQFLSPTLN